MKILDILTRWAVGLVFIFSGFVKAIDPIGGAIQIGDYFQALNLASLKPFGIYFAITAAAIEFLIGIHLIFGIRRTITSWLLLLAMSFFTILTLWMAIFNPVSDCGCFGDAIKLTNWETFFKNVILFIPTIFVFANRRSSDTALSETRTWSITTFFAVIILAVSIYGINHLPLLDFRPYKVGNNIQEGMSIPEGVKQPEYETTFILEKNGEQEEFSTENYPYKDTSWVFLQSKTKIVKEGYEPPIHDFSITKSEGLNLTDSILNSTQPIFLLVSPKIEHANIKSIHKMMEIQAQCRELKYGFFLLTSSSDESVEDFELHTSSDFEILKGDETMIKTLTRANLGLVLLQKGTILGKWNANFTPSVAEFKNPVGAALHFQTSSRNYAYLLVILFLSTTFAFGIFLKRK